MTAELIGENPRPPINRIVAVMSEFSSNFPRGQREVEKLKNSSGLHYTEIWTEKDPLETGAKLLDTLEPTDLVVPVGGDGTINQIIVPMMEIGALLLKTHGGGGCDGARSTIGQAEPWQVFRDYRARRTDEANVHPIETIINDGEPKYANSYVSFGALGRTAHDLNEPWKRPGIKNFADKHLPASLRAAAYILQDGSVLAKAATNVQPFTLINQNPDGSNAPPLKVVDKSLIRSRSMAKFGKFNVPHNQKLMFAFELTEPGFIPLFREFVKMSRGQTKGEYVTSKAFQIINTTDGPLYDQHDGEDYALPDISSVTVGFAKRPLRMLFARHIMYPKPAR